MVNGEAMYEAQLTFKPSSFLLVNLVNSRDQQVKVKACSSYQVCQLL